MERQPRRRWRGPTTSQQDQQNDLASRNIETQQNAVQNNQRALQQAVELPMEQAVEFQKSFAQLFLNGLEMSSRAQNQGIKLTKDMLHTYIDTAEDAVESTASTAEEGTQQAQSLIQQPQQQPPREQQQPQQQQPQQQPAS